MTAVTAATAQIGEVHQHPHGDVDANMAAAVSAAPTAQIGEVHQQPLGDVYTNMMAAHMMRALQTAACDVPRFPMTGTKRASPRPDYTPAWAGQQVYTQQPYTVPRHFGSASRYFSMD